MREVDLRGPNRAVKEAIAEATGFPVSDVYLARDLKHGFVTYCSVHNAHIVSDGGVVLDYLPELVDGFVRELEVIGKHRLNWWGGYYLGDNKHFKVYPSQFERDDRLYYKLFRGSLYIDDAHSPEEAKLFLDTGRIWSERQLEAKGNDEADDPLQ